MKIIKRDGRKQEFSKDKIVTSIKNSAKDCNCSLTASDVNYISKVVETNIKKLLEQKDILTSQELRMLLYEALIECQFKQVAKAYIET